MKGPDERIDARYPTTYTIKEVKQRLFMNHAHDRAWQTENREQ
jgi:hypothetical protein